MNILLKSVFARFSLAPPASSFSLFRLTSSEDGLCCQIVSQLVQVGVFPVVQLPASDAQVEPQPGRVSLLIACPSDFIIAVLLTGALPGGKDEQSEPQTC